MIAREQIAVLKADRNSLASGLVGTDVVDVDKGVPWAAVVDFDDGIDGIRFLALSQVHCDRLVGMTIRDQQGQRQLVGTR